MTANKEQAPMNLNQIQDLIKFVAKPRQRCRLGIRRLEPVRLKG